jgi:hypothetical protein
MTKGEKNEDENGEEEDIKEYKKNRRGRPPKKEPENDEHTNIKIKIMNEAKNCENAEDLQHRLHEIFIFYSPMIFEFSRPEIHITKDPFDQYIMAN